jgi:hypothetical protein
MTTVDLITALFYEVDEQLGAIPKHPGSDIQVMLAGNSGSATH